MARPRSAWLRITTLLVLAAGAWLLRDRWLPLVGWALIRDDGPAKADAALVLAGGYDGGRVRAAAELARLGYVPVVLVSGPQTVYELYESEPAIAFAVRHGYRPEWFVAVNHHALSTSEEARATLPVMRDRGIHSYILVTSNFHTARSARIFRDEAKRIGYDVTMRVVAARDKYFDPNRWWENRESRKTVFFEISKTVATALGQ